MKRMFLFFGRPGSEKASLRKDDTTAAVGLFAPIGRCVGAFAKISRKRQHSVSSYGFIINE
jgi:hypothetical protein